MKANQGKLNHDANRAVIFMIDKFNTRIIQELKRNGRMANVELAERVGLSPSATLRRVQDLEQQGIIKGYRAVLDKSQLAIKFTAFVSVGLSDHRKQSQQDFQDHVANVPEIVECHNVTGASEYLLRIETMDLKDFQRIHTDVIGECQYVSSITTMVVMNTTKDER